MQKAWKEFILNLKEKRITSIAGSWVYFFLMALIPLTCLLFIAFKLLGLNIGERLAQSISLDFEQFGNDLIVTAGELTKGITIFFALSIIFSGSNLFSRMLSDGEFIYGIKRRQKNNLLTRLFSIGALAVLFLLFLGSAFVFTFHEHLINSLKFNNGLFFTFILVLFIIVVGYIVAILFNLFISPIKTSGQGIMLGSLLALGIVVLDTVGFILYMRYFKSISTPYGALSSLIIFLVWTYILMLGLLMGVNLNVCVMKLKKTDC